MARPKAFNPEHTLSEAMKVFWANGFERTSIDDMVEAVGVNRQSLYDTYGDKRELFLKALDHYRHAFLDQWMSAMARTGSALATLEQILEGARAILQRVTPNGCFITATAVEVAPYDEEVAERVRECLLATERVMRRIMVWGQKAGEIRRDVEPRLLARQFLALFQGMGVLARVNLHKRFHRDLCAGILALVASPEAQRAARGSRRPRTIRV